VGHAAFQPFLLFLAGGHLLHPGGDNNWAFVSRPDEKQYMVYGGDYRIGRMNERDGKSLLISTELLIHRA